MQLEDGIIVCYIITSEYYATNAIKNLGEKMEKDGVAPMKVFGNKYGEQLLPVFHRTDIYFLHYLGKISTEDTYN